MLRWTLAIGCAVVLVALVQNAMAYEFDDDGNYVFYDEEELDEFLLWIAGQQSTDAESEEGGGGMLDSCSYYVRPEAYAVTTGHYVSGSWHYHVITDIYWDSRESTYNVYINDNNHALTNVDSLKCNWMHENSGDICDWCQLGGWISQYRRPGSGWYAWTEEESDCARTYPQNDSVYWGKEKDWFSNYDYSVGNLICRFNDSPNIGDYLSKVKIVYVPE